MSWLSGAVIVAIFIIFLSQLASYCRGYKKGYSDGYRESKLLDKEKPEVGNL